MGATTRIASDPSLHPSPSSVISADGADSGCAHEGPIDRHRDRGNSILQYPGFHHRGRYRRDIRAHARQDSARGGSMTDNVRLPTVPIEANDSLQTWRLTWRGQLLP